MLDGWVKGVPASQKDADCFRLPRHIFRALRRGKVRVAAPAPAGVEDHANALETPSVVHPHAMPQTRQEPGKGANACCPLGVPSFLKTVSPHREGKVVLRLAN